MNVKYLEGVVVKSDKNKCFLAEDIGTANEKGYTFEDKGGARNGTAYKGLGIQLTPSHRQVFVCVSSFSCLIDYISFVSHVCAVDS